jgi:hypothetical protein
MSADLNPHFLFEVGISDRMIGSTPVFTRLGEKNYFTEAANQWVKHKISPFNSRLTLL